MKKWAFVVLIPLLGFNQKEDTGTWIRVNQLGYTPAGLKVAVYCSKNPAPIRNFSLVEESTGKTVYKGRAGAAFGEYGPFSQTQRLDFSAFRKEGLYFLLTDGARSPAFRIDADAYKGAADFCLRYMRQQRSGFNPFLNDSCHTRDGYVLYGEKAGIGDSAFVDVDGGWHDASDYLQYATTSANATYHLLAAYRDFSTVFRDEKLANGLDGPNGLADVIDEARWGLDWLLKMHPRKDWMFNQIADDRDHQGMRIPKEDSFYGRGIERPVYFLSGEPQQRGKFINETSGTSSTAGKFAGAFALGNIVFARFDSGYGRRLLEKARTAYDFGMKKPGVAQTASVRSPYIYAEENWTDDMELASASLAAAVKNYSRRPGEEQPAGDFEAQALILSSLGFARAEPVSPWLGADTMKHYQWYPFINLGHYELARQLEGKRKDTVIDYYRLGIERVWQKARANAFYRGIPFIWCSNNLTVSFAIQCYWYRLLTGDPRFAELEQANVDWIFGCNPWGTSMVYGLPRSGDTPVDPHSAFTHLKNYPIDGGLVDGPVYTSIYKNLIGITLYQPDEYAAFQSDLAVYHDDYGDYSTNEPTMDGTASLIYLLAAKEAEASTQRQGRFSYHEGAIIRGDSTRREIALVFTGDEYAEGADSITRILEKNRIKASFFLTGRFYSNPEYKQIVHRLRDRGHFLGPHSAGHLLYCDWNNRDSLLVTAEQFTDDLQENLDIMAAQGIRFGEGGYFLPPFEWYNRAIAGWTRELGIQLVCYTPGTLSHADYTTPGMRNYRDSKTILGSILERESQAPAGLNGFILLMHTGAGEKRTDKFYRQLPALISSLRSKGYRFVKIDQLLKAY